MNSRPLMRISMFVVLAGATLLAGCLSDNGGGGGGGGGGTTTTSANYWTRQAGVRGKSTQGNSVAVDPDGNIYVMGKTSGGLHGRGITGNWDCFIVKYAAAGGLPLAALQTGVPGGFTYGNSIAIDSSRNIYITGETVGGLPWNAPIGSSDAFVIKYNSSWVREYSVLTGVLGVFTTSRGVAVDPAGNVYVTGQTDGGLDGNTRTGRSDYFVTKFTSTGSRVYTIQTGSAGANSVGRAVAVDAAGNVYVTGYTTGGLNGNTQAGMHDYFVTKYSSTGGWVFTKQMGVSGHDTFSQGIAVDSAGNVYVTGQTDASLDIDLITGAADLFVTKYTSTGDHVYTKQRGVALKVTGSLGIAIDASDNVYLTGYTQGRLDNNTFMGTQDYFVTKYTSAGNWVYTRQSGVAAATTNGNGIAVGSGGYLYVAGYTTGGLDGITNVGAEDYFLAKYDSLGNKQ